jgi:Leucine-rich repeat (LRR) protein
LKKRSLCGLPPLTGTLATELKIVDLSSNEFTTFPMELLACTNLKELRLSSNHLTRLPEEIGQLVKLQSLQVDSNKVALPALCFYSRFPPARNAPHQLD